MANVQLAVWLPTSGNLALSNHGPNLAGTTDNVSHTPPKLAHTPPKLAGSCVPMPDASCATGHQFCYARRAVQRNGESVKYIVHVVVVVVVTEVCLDHLDVNCVLRSTMRRPRLESERRDIEFRTRFDSFEATGVEVAEVADGMQPLLPRAQRRQL